MNMYDNNNPSGHKLPYEYQSHMIMNKKNPFASQKTKKVIAIIIMLGLLFIIDSSYINRRKAYHAEQTQEMAETYPTVEGTITETKNVRVKKYSIARRSPYIDNLEVIYSYEYKGNSYSYYQQFDYKHAKQFGYTSDDVINKKVTVYVNPDSPTRSLINAIPKPDFSDWGEMYFGIILIAAAGIIYYVKIYR